MRALRAHDPEGVARAAGRSTKEMAAELVISPYMVQDRRKGDFEKVGGRSRRDLVARLSGPGA